MVNDGVSIEKSFRIKEDDRFFSRLLSKETSKANSSSRVFYYGETSIAVPFTWEAQPGTPKHPSSQTSLPPLTPPPSYYSNSKTSNKRTTKTNIFSCIFPRFIKPSRKHQGSPSSSRSSSSSSSSSWSLVYPSDQGTLSFSRSTTTVRTFLKHKASNRFRGCYSFGNIRNAA
ncbi:uncharacterized protein LOC124830046 [Vigna umbellata]|uniref:Uncharacterized protein n=2 Tax=Phaseolus angularis TaxID=3914 RepID=A0A0L9UW81_PHAAN|nr:uncharacterized protein LOC108336166 [Vigna angularis]XP_047159650.1 uncharacterized protein LOC124830046 [Vigna umbellata]KAG2391147.1 uncharacterized protein HKW66_Vig0130920 [Vigna angularis]KOM46842.1 hypothetical protein LR48_Vigan07g054600 [Vigna angularis]BAT81054.1 hypothetical protein VIGAN_03070900 [Vigna angularis var. angularis]